VPLSMGSLKFRELEPDGANGEYSVAIHCLFTQTVHPHTANC
jgi:hypothetical protein